MECPHCKENIKQGASKCAVCGETLGSRAFIKKLSSFFVAIISAVIPLASLGIAYLEYNERRVISEDKNRIERASREILQNIPGRSLEAAAKESLAPETLKSLRLDSRDFSSATAEFESMIKIDPQNIEAQKGLWYAESLKSR